MSYYRTCPHCGATLDPGEICECVQSSFSQLTDENKIKINALISRKLEEQEREEHKRRYAAMTDEQKQIRKELVEMICAMNEQQFAWFCEKVMEVLTPDERDFYEKTGKITTE